RNLLLARCDRRRLLRELGRGLRALLVADGELAQLRSHVLLAFGRPRLLCSELLLGLAELPALGLDGLEPLRQVPLPFLERGLVGGEPARALVELGRPLGERL